MQQNNTKTRSTKNYRDCKIKCDYMGKSLPAQLYNTYDTFCLVNIVYTYMNIYIYNIILTITTIIVILL